ncbi:MAG: STAS domain-containing protein [Proteobacteria bacterium]|jgi:anti-anti-sigma factor|nr:STAS domain-containing protein [Pseudomonadota bacterium]
MRYEQSTVGKWWVLKFNGRLDSFTQDKVVGVIDQGSARGKIHICLDLREVSFLSFSLIRLLAMKDLEMKNQGGQLVIMNATAVVVKHLETFNPTKGLQHYKSFAEFEKQLVLFTGSPAFSEAS